MNVDSGTSQRRSSRCTWFDSTAQARHSVPVSTRSELNWAQNRPHDHVLQQSRQIDSGASRHVRVLENQKSHNMMLSHDIFS